MGPLEGIRIVELAGIGPGPFCAMLLSDMGAEIIRVDRAAMVGLDTDRDGNDSRFNLLARGRRNIAVDLKNPAAVDAVLRLIDQADALLEYLELGPLLPHPLIGIVGLAEVAAQLDLAEGGREPLFLRDGHRRDQNRQARPEDECQQAANLSHWPPCY